jgi:hypothetical protein
MMSHTLQRYAAHLRRNRAAAIRGFDRFVRRRGTCRRGRILLRTAVDRAVGDTARSRSGCCCTVGIQRKGRTDAIELRPARDRTEKPAAQRRGQPEPTEAMKWANPPRANVHPEQTVEVPRAGRCAQIMKPHCPAPREAGQCSPNPKQEDVMQPDRQPLAPGDEGPPDAPGVGEDLCARCHGTGMVEGKRCEVCGGTGKLLQGIGG